MKRRTLAQLGFHPDFSAVGIDDCPANGQAEADPAACGAAAHKFLENAFLLAGRDAGAPRPLALQGIQFAIKRKNCCGAVRGLV